jgi:UDP-2,3-diacylglucosamine pyrophosphatase LpxH
MAHYKSIFISDIHLGTKGSQADSLCAFLKENTCENLFLVGDIIDGWQLKKRWYFPQSHANVIRRIFTAAKRGTNVYYILGNHDEAFRKFLMFDIEVGNIKLLDKYDYYAVNGKKYLIIHGDFFDALMLNKKWLMHIGDTAYNIMIWINTHFNFVRSLFGMEYWSLSKWLKQNTKEALNFIHNFEDHVSTYCKNGNYDGIICGHIHTAEIKNINDVEYMNSGDWVESCTAVVEHMNGNFELIEKIRVEKTYEQDTIDN